MVLPKKAKALTGCQLLSLRLRVSLHKPKHSCTDAVSLTTIIVAIQILHGFCDGVMLCKNPRDNEDSVLQNHSYYTLYASKTLYQLKKL